MVTLYKSESELFADIRWLEYGVLLDVYVPEEGEMVEFRLTPSEEVLYEYLQDGYRHFHSISVSNGLPMYFETEGRTKVGTSYKKKVLIKG